MGAVTALLCVPIPTASIFVDVASRVVSTLVIDGEDECGLFPSWEWLRMDRHLLFIVGQLIALFYGRPPTSRGRALGLLNCCYLEQSLHLVSNASRLGIRWLRHIAQQHCCRHDVLPVDFSSSSADTSTRWVRQVLLKNLLEQDQALAILVKLCLELL